MILISINGFISIAIYSVCYEYVVELTPGIGESISGGFINNFGNILGFLEINLIQFLGKLDKSETHTGLIDYAMIVIFCCLILAFILLLCVKEKMTNTNTQEKGKKVYHQLEGDLNYEDSNETNGEDVLKMEKAHSAPVFG